MGKNTTGELCAGMDKPFKGYPKANLDMHKGESNTFNFGMAQCAFIFIADNLTL